MVGCVIASADGRVIAEGAHRRCGEAHAEINALRAAGERARGATAVVTLEPCAHHGRTGPCCDALIAAGVSAVIYAVKDPHRAAGGGGARLQSAGVQTMVFPHARSTELTLPFLKRIRTGLPWISAKWAQSIDGAVALANGESKWLSCPRSRTLVHRERGRVDAIMTGIGTVMEDDPQLTPRGVRTTRTPQRIVFDPDARTPLDARVLDGSLTTTVLVRDERDGGIEARCNALLAAGARILRLGAQESLVPPLRTLCNEGVSTVLVEAGGGLTGRLVREQVLDEAWVFIAPLLVSDDAARRAARGLAPEVLAAIPRARLLGARTRGCDALLHYRWAAAAE